jgi:hypothetical protein
VWGKYEQDVIEFAADWYILSFAAKWLDKNKIHVHALPDYEGYERDRTNDKALVGHLWHYLDQADIIVAHNGDRFDLRKINARAVLHGLGPPSPYRTVDTLKIARRHFKFDSNRLDDLSKYLGLGSKLPHTGKHLWLSCMAGDEEAWRLLRRYNRHDVVLLERVYLQLRPWSTTHPNLTWFSRADGDCPVCESHETKKSGWHYNRTSRRQRRTCLNCGHRYNLGKLEKV